MCSVTQIMEGGMGEMGVGNETAPTKIAAIDLNASAAAASGTSWLIRQREKLGQRRLETREPYFAVTNQ